MKHFIVYDATGIILRTGRCHDDTLALQGELVIEGIADDSLHCIIDGQVTDIPIPILEVAAHEENKQRGNQKLEKMIKNKMQSILRGQAVDELKKEGKL